MQPRPLFLSILLFAQLALSLTLGTVAPPWLIPLAMPLSLLLPTLLVLRAPLGTPPLGLRVKDRRAFLSLALLPAFVLLTAGLSLGWSALARRMGLPLTPVTPREPFLLALLLDALLPALAEEIFCRGALFSVLRPLGRRAAILGSAILFAMMHANAAQIPYALLAGLLLALLYELTGSLLFPFLFHFANNLTSILLYFGATPLLVFSLLGGAALLGLLLLGLVLWRKRPALPGPDAPLSAFLREFFSLPILCYLAVMLVFTVMR